MKIKFLLPLLSIALCACQQNPDAEKPVLHGKDKKKNKVVYTEAERHKYTGKVLTSPAYGNLPDSGIERESIKLKSSGSGDIAGRAVMDKITHSDLYYVRKAQAKANNAPIGEMVPWNNPSTGYSGIITPVRDGRTHTGAICREYSVQLFVSEKAVKTTDTLCRQPDGSWRFYY